MGLAQAYSKLATLDEWVNRDMLKRALELMQAHDDELREDYYWNFCMGYAYYYLDQEGPALWRFQDALELRRFPVNNLVWVGLHNGKKGLCGYTAGMRNFGYDEMEVLDSSAGPEDLLDFLNSIASLVISEDVILEDGETIGFLEDQQLPITKSQGVAVEGDSLKIGY